MLLHFRRLQPRDPVLLKSLNPWLELGLLKSVVINGANTGNAHARVAGATAV